jgi:hypothetical protein
VWVSHVTFRNQGRAGIFLDQINTWDNNFLDHVNFVDCPAGFRQLPDPNYPGGHTPTMCFVDKVVFYRCRFVRCGVAIDMPARRPNNLNAWINCLFQDNREAVARLTNCTTHLFANCDLTDNGGDPCICSNRPVHFVSCRFRSRRRGRSMLPKDSSAAGCVFRRGTSSRATILSAAGRNHFYNCTSVDMPLGKMHSGLLLNSALARDAPLNHQAVSVRQGTPTVLVPGKPSPRPQLLVGKPMRADCPP